MTTCRLGRHLGTIDEPVNIESRTEFRDAHAQRRQSPNAQGDAPAEPKRPPGRRDKRMMMISPTGLYETWLDAPAERSFYFIAQYQYQPTYCACP